jgi:gluconate 2-dehydrogenase alpha chain
VAQLPSVDVVLVGFGLVNGVIANELAKQTSLNIVALERGPFRTTDPDFLQDHFDEWRYAVQGELFQDLGQSTITFRNDRGQTALPMRQWGAFLVGSGVGGSMVHWNGHSFRFLPHEFEYRSHLERRYGPGFLPEETTIQDWGITYDQLEPYYVQYEKTFGIAGKAGNLRGIIQQGGNPYEGARGDEFPQPPIKQAYGPTLFRDACAQLGYRVFPSPAGISPAPYTNPDGMTLGSCNYCGFCERFGCHVGAKASPIVTVVPSALRSGRVQIRQFSTAYRINHRDGQAVSVSYYDGSGQEQEQPADLIVVGAWTLESVRLLLLSGIGQPYDPVQSTGVVGKNYTFQTGGAGATIWYDDRIMNRFMGAGSGGFAIAEYQSDNFDHAGLGFFGGGLINSVNTGARPIESSGPLPPGTPTWGSGWKAGVKQYYNRSVGFAMQGESPAYRQNSLDLDPTYRDAWGNPLLRMTFNWTDNERRMVRWMRDNPITEIAKAMGGSITQVQGDLTDYSIVPYQTTHCQGGAIMGMEPRTSVVNPFLQSWDLPNLFVVGASAFPQNPGSFPTATVGALACRAADAIIHQYLANPRPLA